MSEIYLLMTVTKRTMGRRLLSCYEHNGLSAVLCTLAKGTATSEILDCLGLEMTEKAVMMAVILATQYPMEILLMAKAIKPAARVLTEKL